METTIQPTETQILQEKLEQRLSSHEDSVLSTIQTIEHDAQNIEDFIVPFSPKTAEGLRYSAYEGRVRANFEDVSLSFHDRAIAQLAERYGLSGGYLRSLNSSSDEWKSHLAAHTLNEYNQHTTGRVLFRSIQGQVRGALSASYKRLNTVDVASGYAKAVQSQGAEFYNASYDETRWWLEALYPRVFSVPGKNEGEVIPVAFGTRLSTSDFGDGALNLQTFMVHVVCLNGMVRSSAMRQVHIGGKLPSELELSNRTYRLDSEATASAVTDMTLKLFSKESLLAQAAGIRKAAELVVNLSQEIKRLPAVGMTKQEAKEVEEVFVANRPEDGVSGEGTLWKLTQGITAVARNKDGRRRAELEEIAGAIMENRLN